MVREKKRYISVKAEPQIEADKIVRAVRSAYLRLFGELGLIEAEFRVVRKMKNGVVIFGCRLPSLPRLVLAVASIRRIDEREVALRILRVSGTVKRAREAAE